VNPLITNDAIVIGILLVILALVFQGEQHPRTKRFFEYVPGILICYFVPGLLNSFGVISGDQSKLYFVASRYLLPASLVLFCVSLDFSALRKLGTKSLLMFFSGTLGVFIGGPLALLIVGALFPSIVAPSGADETWRGFATLAGSWIGGGANQTALKEVFKPSDNLFSATIAVDVIVANVWLAILLYGAGISEKIDRWLKADASAIETVKQRILANQRGKTRIPSLTDLLTIVALGIGCTSLGHWGSELIVPFLAKNAPYLAQFSLLDNFVWIVLIATALGIGLSFTPARELENAGASRIGSLFLFVLIATIGMKMNVLAIFSNPAYFLIGIIWMTVHAVVILTIAKIIRAPFFFVAVGSQANIGAAASAPIVASAFHPSLAPIGVILAVLGYAVGTYAGYICGLIMEMVYRSFA
jgi:uncharacterized membrane protein